MTDPDYNPYGQERYDNLARNQYTAQGSPGPKGDTPKSTVEVLSGRYITTWSGSTTEIASYTFSNNELNPGKDLILIQAWPTSETADQAVYSETVSVAWNYGATSTTLFSMPVNAVSAYCWYAYIAQFSDDSNADVLHIDPGYTPLQNIRAFGPAFNTITIGNDWMSNGGSLVFYANRVVAPAPASIVFRTIIKVWKSTS